MNQSIKASTQDHLGLEDVSHNLILKKDGSAAMALQVSAVNFGLLSEDEQDAIIYSYAALLNSLSFPIQILIRSQKKDISDYVKLLQKQEQSQTHPILKKRINQYRRFIENIVKERRVLDKKFYIIIPFSHADLGLNPGTNISSLDKSYLLQKAINTLEPRRDHLLRQLARLGVAAKQLSTQQLIQLLYAIYNPDSGDGFQAVLPEQYQSPLVQSTTPPPQSEASS